MIRRRKFPLLVGGIESVLFADVFLKDVVDIVKNSKILMAIHFWQAWTKSVLGNYLFSLNSQ